MLRGSGKALGILVIIGFLFGCTAPSVAVNIQISQDVKAAEEGAGADLVFEAYSILKQNFYDPSRINYVDLFNAALNGAALELKKENVEFYPEKLDSSLSLDAAKAKLATEFKRAKTLAINIRVWDQNHLGFAAVDYMIESVGDSHCYFMSPAMVQERRRSRSGEAAYVGIGVRMRQLENGYFYISTVFPDSPADRAGLKVYDRLVAIDGHKINADTDLDDIAKRIRGLKNTIVQLTIERRKNIQTINIKRDEIVMPRVSRELIQQGDYLFGRIIIYGFEWGVYGAVYDSLTNFQQIGVKGIILDLRDNPGGYVDVLQRICEIFLPKNTVIFRSKYNSGWRQYIVRYPPLTNLPLVVLIDGGSASASEVTAAAMQEAGRAKIIGDKSAGAVGIGNSFAMSYDTEIMVTVAQCFTPSGRALEKNGVTPDIWVPINRDIESGRDLHLDVAIAELQNQIK